MNRASSERRNRRQRSQRATWACERCRIKKLRCTGGHPCSACHRAGIDCDFGDRHDSNLNLSITNQRLAQLETTVTALLAATAAGPRPPPRSPGAAPIQPPSHCLPSTFLLSSGQQLSGSIPASSNAHHGLASSDPGEPRPCMHTPSSLAHTVTGPVDSHETPSHVSPLDYPHEPAATADRMRRSPPGAGPEGLESRWAALQQNPAPFPPLMSHPTVWSGESVKDRTDGDAATQPALGMTSYTAKVDLHSEPVASGIVCEPVARLLFALFFQKCHSSFPILGSTGGPDDNFDRMRSSSPFLFTVILSIAGRYYPKHRETQPASSMPNITPEALEALAELACAHLGFVIFRKQHQLSDVQATLLLSVWIPRGYGQSADQWMVTGICTRLAHRIGIPDTFSRPAIATFLGTDDFGDSDVHEVNDLLRQWHTWLIIYQYDTSLSLGFGRPHVPAAIIHTRDYLNIVRKLGSSSAVDLAAATYVVSLAELCTISTELISGLRLARLPPMAGQDQASHAAIGWSRISTLLSELNPRLDEWQRRWTWNGSYDAISMGKYITLSKIYSEHTRLCLNSLSLNLLAGTGTPRPLANPMMLSSLAKACESAMTLVQLYDQTGNGEAIIRYGGDYLVLILGQAAIFLIRALVARLDQPLPVDRLVLEHYLRIAMALFETNDFSTTGVCGWMAQLVRALARHAGVALNGERETTDANPTLPDPNCAPQLEWDFDISLSMGQNILSGEPGINLGDYFDFAQSSYFPAGPAARGTVD
ncbi:Zn(II)2Cys6 transcription factor [Aspergillus homomorphus CBS 101889]|uniref:Transcriptional activator of proteases prtT n=1 Tax=Aspergillus homomorphus (strain CBS 101889) TaxID=1450537 RepID=A0A395HNB1_ASPHC|nr:putative C6 finger domain protein [Aspergillus homomorphus CBS 101889]RAL08765.1 putative C6 finger domain protein [Aspergillus homomorphus CBS 101889]